MFKATELRELVPPTGRYYGSQGDHDNADDIFLIAEGDDIVAFTVGGADAGRLVTLLNIGLDALARNRDAVKRRSAVLDARAKKWPRLLGR